MYISNFGATIELDQKIYTPNDKIHITIVAPDLNFDSNVIDEIGQASESMIRIRTGIDELTNYKLIETDPNTGIFTGEIQLTDNMELSQKSKQNLGSNNSIICCKREDSIVVLNLFGIEEFVGRALIMEKK